MEMIKSLKESLSHFTSEGQMTKKGKTKDSVTETTIEKDLGIPIDKDLKCSSHTKGSQSK